MDKMKMETTNKTLENLAKLKEMFPEVITETKDENGEIVAAVDAKKLEQLLSTKVRAVKNLLTGRTHKTFI